MSSYDTLHSLSQFCNGSGRLRREESYRYIMSHTCSIGERSGALAGQSSFVHHEENVAAQQSYVDVRCPAEKALHLPVEEMAVPWV